MNIARRILKFSMFFAVVIASAIAFNVLTRATWAKVYVHNKSSQEIVDCWVSLSNYESGMGVMKLQAGGQFFGRLISNDSDGYLVEVEFADGRKLRLQGADPANDVYNGASIEIHDEKIEFVK